MLHFHWCASLLCREIPVSSQHLFGLRHRPLSYPLQVSIRFLKHPLPSTPFVGLATFHTFFVGVYTGYQVPYQRYFGALGAIYRPGIVSSACHPINSLGQPDSMPFWPKCITLFSLVCFDDPFDDSAFASPWRLFPCRLNSSGYHSFLRCPVGFTPSCYRERMPRQGHLKRIGVGLIRNL